MDIPSDSPSENVRTVTRIVLWTQAISAPVYRVLRNVRGHSCGQSDGQSVESPENFRGIVRVFSCGHEGLHLILHLIFGVTVNEDFRKCCSVFRFSVYDFCLFLILSADSPVDSPMDSPRKIQRNRNRNRKRNPI